jgi:hypothetical protein
MDKCLLVAHTSTDDALLWGSSKRPAGLQWPTATRVMFGLETLNAAYGLLGGDRCGSCASARPFSAPFRHLSCHSALGTRAREIDLGFPCQIVPVIHDPSRFFCVKPWLWSLSPNRDRLGLTDFFFCDFSKSTVPSFTYDRARPLRSSQPLELGFSQRVWPNRTARRRTKLCF